MDVWRGNSRRQHHAHSNARREVGKDRPPPQRPAPEGGGGFKLLPLASFLKASHMAAQREHSRR